MVDNVTLGRRVRQCRQALGLTLKVLEGKAGVSATHISEIERGRTSPTIGALEKLAGALERDIAYFVESAAREDMEVQRALDRHPWPLEAQAGRFQSLSGGVPGSRLGAAQIDLEPGQSISVPELPGGEDVYYVQSGTVRFQWGDEIHVLGEGDAIHLRASEPYLYVSEGDGPARLFQFSAERPSMQPSPGA